VSHSSTIYSHANIDATAIAPTTRGDDNFGITNSDNSKNRTKKTSNSKNIVKTEIDFFYMQQMSLVRITLYKLSIKF
jgi:hypothetical protein